MRFINKLIKIVKFPEYADHLCPVWRVYGTFINHLWGNKFGRYTME